MPDSKLCIVVVLWRNVDISLLVKLIQLFQHGGVCALEINQSTRVKRAVLCYV